MGDLRASSCHLGQWVATDLQLGAGLGSQLTLLHFTESTPQSKSRRNFEFRDVFSTSDTSGTFSSFWTSMIPNKHKPVYLKIPSHLNDQLSTRFICSLCLT